MYWEMIRNGLSEVMPENALSLWINPLKCLHESDTSIELAGPDRFFCSWVTENYLPRINSVLEKLGMPDTRITITVDPEQSVPMLPPGISHQQMRLPNVPKNNTAVRVLHPRFTFDEFMTGESNLMARSACEAIANDDSSISRCLFIDSDTGLGKSHLTHAVAHKILAESPGTRLHYLTSQQLTAEMVRSIRSNSMDDFKEKYHSQCDVLLVEDIHSLSGRSKTQEELAAVLDILLEKNKRVIFTSKVPARDIADIDPGFRSRLSSGLVTSINPPDFKTRCHIIKRKAGKSIPGLSEELIGYLAENIRGDIRQVESAIIGLKAKTSLLRCPADLDMVKEVLSNIITSRANIVSALMIRDFIAEQFKTSHEELCSKSRKKTVAFPRQVAMYLARKLTDQPLGDIGKAFNRDHSTVVHSVKVITESINRCGSVRGQVDLLTRKLKKKFD
ncbi:MAG: chromosomal replication initiator protein DnaA [Proteobacteria bacterium]|nr:chromosomal replication initiator protein DnaA [Pseudomonadota bacterium]MBU1736986.1 chromosomal replication initiator protein DnaA [Pseudomonadota bacterium]